VGTACGDGEIGGPAGPTVAPPIDGGPFTIAIADFPPLANVGGIARVDGGSATPIAVARLGASSFVAMSMICPHAGYRPISIVPGGFICPNHGAEFETDGQWSGGQPTRDLVLYVVDYDAGAGTLTIS
jgi:Rieske Fe-S protein